MLPFISSSRWNRIFKSGFATMISAYANYYFTIFLVLLGVCFADSIREMRKYSHTDSAEASLSNNPNTVDHIHMKLFRAEKFLHRWILSLSLVCVETFSDSDFL